MNKKFYEAPEMEMLDVKINYSILDVSDGAGDPEVKDHWDDDDSGFDWGD